MCCYACQRHVNRWRWRWRGCGGFGVVPGVADERFGAEVSGVGVADGVAYVVAGSDEFVEGVHHALEPEAAAAFGEDADVDPRAVGQGEEVDENSEGRVADSGVLEDIVAKDAERPRTRGKMDSH